MARIRSIKPDAFTSDSLSTVPRGTRWTFAGLWTYCDDEGRGRADVRLIKAALYPLDDSTTLQDIAADMEQLRQIGSVCTYNVGGRDFLHVPAWEGHQKVNRPTPSKFPACPSCDGSTEPHGSLRESAVRTPALVNAEREQGTGNREVSADAEAPARPEVQALCDLLAELVEQNGSKRPVVTKRWHDAARLLIDNDKREVEEIERVIRWAQASDFWRSNVLSMPKLREKFDTLRLQAQRDARPARDAGKPDRSHLPEAWR